MSLEFATVTAADAALLADSRALLNEYQQQLGIDLAFQGFAEELRDLPGEYGAAGGLLLLGYEGEVPVCCGAVRPFAVEPVARAELKRVYVRPAYRQHGYGRVLVRRLLDFARASGYAEIRLDTLPSMAAARGLYAELGFREIPAYVYNPVPGTAYLGLNLQDPPPAGAMARPAA